jgi:hypothetical protein
MQQLHAISKGPKTNLALNFALALSILQHIYALTWNVDPYHEGALFPSAAGMASGLRVFSEVSQQYGFLTPLLISIPLKLLGNYLLIGRVIGFLTLMLISFFLYKLLIHLSTKVVAKFITVTWLAVNPIWSWPITDPALSGGAWPNHYGILLILIGLNFLIRYQDLKFNSFIAGFVVAASGHARFEFFFVWLFMTLALFFYFKSKLLIWTIGSFLALSLSIIYLIFFSSLTDWYVQTLRVWTMDPPGVPAINLNFFIFNGIHFFGLILLFLVMSFSAQKLYSRISSIPIVVSYLCLSLWLLMLVGSRIEFVFKVGNYDVSNSFVYLSRYILFSYVNVALIFFVFTFWNLNVKPSNLEDRESDSNGNLRLLGFTCLGTLGLFHNFNPDYSHMIIPVYLIFLVAYFSKYSETLRTFRFKEGLVLTALSSILVASILFFGHSSKTIYPYQNEMLKGLRGNSYENVSNLDQSLDVIESYVTKGEMLMNCQVGLLSTNSEGFLGSDKWTWNQQPYEMLSGRVSKMPIGHSLLACNLDYRDEEIMKQFLDSNVLTLLYSNSTFSIYKRVK